MHGRSVLYLLAATALAAIEVGEWSAPSCPPSLLTPRVRADASGVRVSVLARGDVLVGSLEVSRDGKTRRRTHEATSCEALIDVLALGVELAQGPKPQGEAAKAVGLARGPAEKKEEPARIEVASAQRVEETPPIEVKPSDVVSPPPLVVQAPSAPEEVSLTPALSPAGGEGAPSAPSATVAEPLPEAQPSTPTRLEVGAHALVVFGPSPAPGFGAELSGSWLPLNGLFRIELSLQHARTATVGLGPGRGRFSLTTARLGACSPALAIGLANASVCASVAGGAIWAQGFPTSSITSGGEITLPWFDAAAQARVGVDLGHGLKIEARAGPTFPFNRHTFVFEQPRVDLYTVSVVGFEGGLGLSFSP